MRPTHLTWLCSLRTLLWASVVFNNCILTALILCPTLVICLCVTSFQTSLSSCNVNTQHMSGIKSESTIGSKPETAGSAKQNNASDNKSVNSACDTDTFRNRLLQRRPNSLGSDNSTDSRRRQSRRRYSHPKSTFPQFASPSHPVQLRPFLNISIEEALER